MRRRVGAISLLAITLLVGCGGDDQTDADRFVVQACDLTKASSDDGTSAWLGPPSPEPNSSGWTLTDSLEELERLRDAWSRRAVPAAAAAQLELSMRALSDAVQGMLATMDTVVQYRERGWALDESQAGLPEYNNRLSIWRTECNAAAARLNK